MWITALWFWMVTDNDPVTSTMQDEFKRSFGDSIRKINGALECGGRGPAQMMQRVNYFRNWCTRLEVEPGSNLEC